LEWLLEGLDRGISKSRADTSFLFAKLTVEAINRKSANERVEIVEQYCST
jgi:hypothetical protein